MAELGIRDHEQGLHRMYLNVAQPIATQPVATQPEARTRTTTTTRVAFLGDAFVDVQTSPMTSLPEWDEDRVVSSVSVFPGGSVVNSARHFGSLGKSLGRKAHGRKALGGEEGSHQEAHLCVTVGDDSLGTIMMDVIRREESVQLDHVTVAKNVPMSTCLVLVGPGGRRAFVR